MFRKLLLSLILPTTLFAQTAPVTQEPTPEPVAKEAQTKSHNPSALTLKADAGEIDFAAGIAVYSGNVEIAQDALKVKGDKVSAKLGSNEKLQNVEAVGKPAKFEYQPPKQPKIYGEGQRLQYDLQKQLLIIEGNAKIRQGEHQTTAQSLVYDIKAEKLRSQKVQMIYQVPKK